METQKNTAKHFVLQLGSLISLYLSLTFLLVLLFGVINISFPDAVEGYWEIESAANSIRLGIAMVIVFFPTYLFLTRAVNKNRRQTDSGAYLSVTRWLIYLSLLIGGGALLADLVAVILTFLNGEITERFILKAFAVLVVIGAAFHYYLLDARGYWVKNEQKSIMYAIGTILVVLASLGYGFTHIKSPVDVREARIDDTQITDLQSLQWRIQDYLVLNGTLPQSLADLGDETAFPVPPEGRDAYEYKVTEKGFALCATFATPSPDEQYYPRYSQPIGEKGIILNPDNWHHGVGYTCFERAVSL